MSGHLTPTFPYILNNNNDKMGFVEKRHPRIGVYICHCGHNIGGVVDVKKIREYAENLPLVVIARDHKYICSDLGQSIIARDIKDYNLERVVVASCSPRLHEIVFREVLESSDMNPNLFEMVNIREQCSWVHSNDPEKATEKAKDLIRSAVSRASLLEPIEKIRKDVTKSVLVIGGGVAGIFSTLYLARAGIKTYLVEKEPSIGGNMAKLDKTYPALDCAMCVLSPKMVEVKKEKNIELMANAEIMEISGHVGNFKIKVKKNPRFVKEEECVSCGNCATTCPVKIPDEFNQNLSKRRAIYIPFPQAIPNSYLIDRKNCLYFKTGGCRLCEKKCENNAIDFDQNEEIIELDVGAIILATGVRIFDARRKKPYGYGKYRNVVTNLDFERILNADGPTRGKLKRPSDGKKPESIAFIQCVGSRDDHFNKYCSVICCMISIKHALLIKEKYPDVNVYIYYNDIRTPGKEYEEFYLRAKEKGVIFLRGLPSEILENSETENLRIVSEDINSGEIVKNELDLVVLATGLEPNDIVPIVNQLHLNYGPDGFMMEAHPKLRPVDTNIDGVFLAGNVQFPKSISDTVSQAGNAAVSAINIISQEEIPIEEITAFVDNRACNGCRLCLDVCPYDAIKFNYDRGIAEVMEIACKGCGACVATCPSGAIQQKHFLDSQILSQIEALLD